MTGPVVVGIDGSPASAPALHWAAGEAALRRRPLHLLHACGWPLPDLPLGPDVYRLRAGGRTAERVGEAAEHLLAKAAEQVRTDEPRLDVTTEVSTDLPSAALIAASRRAALVVVGSRGLGGFAGLLVGSVGVQVAAHAHSPVVVVRRPDGGGNVVVGVDGSDASAAAIRYGFEQATWRGTGLTAVHAWRWPARREPGDMLPLVYDPAEVADEAERLLAEAVAGSREKYPEVPIEPRLVHGSAASALVAASDGATLTVVGCRGRGGFAGLLLGSVSQQVLHHAGSPVAVVRVP